MMELENSSAVITSALGELIQRVKVYCEIHFLSRLVIKQNLKQLGHCRSILHSITLAVGYIYC